MGISGGLPGLKHKGKLVAKPLDALSFLLPQTIWFHQTGNLSTNVAKVPGRMVRVVALETQLLQDPSSSLRSTHTRSCAKQKNKKQNLQKASFG